MADSLAALLWLFLLPLATSWLLTALLVRWAPRLGLVDYPSARKIHVQPTPHGGGLAIFAGVVSGAVGKLQWQLLLAAIIVVLGLIDDLRPLRWQVRLLVQFAVAIVAVFVCLPPQPWFVRVAAVVWIATMINAFNMLDNMDALSGGVAWIAAGFLAMMPWLTGTPSLAEWGPFIALMGALSGFLWFNRPPARIFMGDAGSTFLGFLLGLGSVQVVLREPRPSWSWLAAPCILAVPCYDLVSVVVLRLSQGRSPFHADKRHLSHRLVARGRSSVTAVGAIYLLALASGASGVILYFVSSWTAAALTAAQLLAWWIALAVIEFAAKEHCHDTQAQHSASAEPRP